MPRSTAGRPRVHAFAKINDADDRGTFMLVKLALAANPIVGVAVLSSISYCCPGSAIRRSKRGADEERAPAPTSYLALARLRVNLDYDCVGFVCVITTCRCRLELKPEIQNIAMWLSFPLANSFPLGQFVVL
jgi:hypothetical protein